MTTIPAIYDAAAQWNAVKVLLVASPLGNFAYDYGKVPGADGNSGALPTTYVEFAVAPRYVPTNNGRTGRAGWRVMARYVGNTSPNARVVGGWIWTALKGARITVGDVQSTPLAFTPGGDELTPDDGMYSGEFFFDYVL